MSHGFPHPRSRVDVTAWSDVSSRDALELLTSAVAEMVGFEVASLSAVEDGEFFAVSVQGDDETRDVLLGLATPVDALLPLLDLGDDWGRFRFVPHDRIGHEVDQWTWIPVYEPLDGPDAWHPEDLCVAPLRSEAGALIGTLSIDLPISGRRPGAAQRRLLERYAAQAERALRMAVERAELSARLRLAETARQVVRLATVQADFDRALDGCRQPLMEGYQADFLAIRTYPADDQVEGGAPATSLGGGATATVRAAVRRCWDAQRVALISETLVPTEVMSAAEHVAVVQHLATLDIGLAMLVPLGSGTECLGHLLLGRKDPLDMWSTEEQSAAFDIARDIGQAVLANRNRAREQRLMEALRRLATYKTQLLSTVSHELKNPLGVISGHLELLDGATDLTDDTQFSVAAMARASRRMGRVVDDLLLLSQVEDPDAAVTSESVPIPPLVHEALEMMRFAAQQRNLKVVVRVPDHPVLGCGDPRELDRVVTNLLSNAVKYTPRGRSITVTVLDHGPEVEIAVADEGIGISDDDQERLFTEFFRSTNPRALAQPGTGLGLAICARIVARHDGRIEVESELGVGSTFRVFLPTPGA